MMLRRFPDNTCQRISSTGSPRLDLNWRYFSDVGDHGKQFWSSLESGRWWVWFLFPWCCWHCHATHVWKVSISRRPNRNTHNTHEHEKLKKNNNQKPFPDRPCSPFRGSQNNGLCLVSTLGTLVLNPKGFRNTNIVSSKDQVYADQRRLAQGVLCLRNMFRNSRAPNHSNADLWSLTLQSAVTSTQECCSADICDTSWPK